MPDAPPPEVSHQCPECREHGFVRDVQPTGSVDALAVSLRCIHCRHEWTITKSVPPMKLPDA